MSSEVKQSAKGELVFTGFLFAASLIVLWDTFSIAESQVAGVIGPKVFAYGIGGLMFVLSIIQFISVARGNLGEPDEIEGGVKDARSNWAGLFVLIGGIAAHILLVELIGFIIAGAILFFAVTWSLGERRYIRMALISVAIAAAIYFLFTKGLQLDLPWGWDFSGNADTSDVEDW